MEIDRPPHAREDCWSEGATYTLIEAWGDRHLELNRGNLRQKHWQEVAHAVNARHGAVNKAARSSSCRTDVQCRNRIDTLKKKYKTERARILSSGGETLTTSNWPFYYRLHSLIGVSTSSGSSMSMKKKKPSLPFALPLQPCRKSSFPSVVVPVPVVGTRLAVKEKKQPSDGSFFRGNYSAVAAAAAAADSGSTSTESGRGNDEEEEVDGGFKELAQAIVRFGEIYERVEEAKQRQMIELEKQRMDFMKSLEFERMQIFVDTQVQLEKIKRAKRAAVEW